MKKILKTILYSFLVIFLGGFIFIYVYYHSYSPEHNDISVNKDDLAYFRQSYDECRQAFLSDVSDIKQKYSNVKTHSIQIESNIDSNLIMDICYIPAQQDSSQLLVLISGTHGAEGFSGSAIQQMFISELLNDDLVNDMGVLLIHAVNPYGFKYNRRATEFNIDLNRNCGIDKSVFGNTNPGYKDMYKMLCPSGEVRRKSLGNQFFYMDAIWNILKESMATLRQAIAQGQYDFPEGLFYGGDDYAPQIYALQSILPDIFEPYKSIYTIDLHTGFGEWAKLHLFPNPEEDEFIKSSTEFLFEGHNIHWGDSANFYTITGHLSGLIKQINPKAVSLCMTFEFGTMNSQETIGSLVSIHRMILENQGFHHGYKNRKTEEKVMNDYREMFFPSSEIWRSELIRQSREMIEFSLGQFIQLKTELEY